MMVMGLGPSAPKVKIHAAIENIMVILKSAFSSLRHLDNK
jgi:hypothetical protein